MYTPGARTGRPASASAAVNHGRVGQLPGGVDGGGDAGTLSGPRVDDELTADGRQRSVMLVSLVALSNPRPVSLIVRLSVCSWAWAATMTVVAGPPCLAAFCSASLQQ